MAEISDIVLRIRVDIVNTKAIAGLITSLQNATTAVRNNSRASAVAAALSVRASEVAQRAEERKTALAVRAAATVKRLEDRAAAAQVRVTAQAAKAAAAAQRLADRTAAVQARLAEKVARAATAAQRMADRTAATQTRASERSTKAAERAAAAIARVAARQAAAEARAIAQTVRAKERASATAQRLAQRTAAAEVRASAQAAKAAERAAAAGVRAARQEEAAQARLSREKVRAAIAAQKLADKNRQLYGIMQLLRTAIVRLASPLTALVSNLGKVERKMDAVFRAGVHMQSMGRDLLGFARKMFTYGKQMLDTWGEFEYTLNRAAAAAGIFSNQTPLYDKLKDAIYGVARELKLFDTEKVAKALYFWQSTTGETIDTQEKLASTMKNVTAVMKLAAMTDSNYETVIKGVYSTIKQFGLAIEDTADVSALLYYATQKTALELPDLINAFKMTGAVMGQAQEPLTSMVAVLGAIGNAGFRGSQAGRALRQTYIKIVKPTAAAKVELNKLFKAQGGYNKVAFDSKGNFVGMEKYMMRMAKATQGMTYKQRAFLLATITTANELPVMTQMLRMAEQAVKSGDKTWTQFIVNQKIANDTFNDSWTMVSTSWKGVVGGLKQSVMPVLLEVGSIVADMLKPTLLELADTIWGMGPAMESMAKGLAETFRPFVEWLGKGIKKITAWARANQKVVATFAKYGIIGTIISGVAGAFLLLAGTVSLVIANLVVVIAGALPLIALFIGIGVVIAALAVGFYRNVGGIQQSMARFSAAVARAFRVFFGGSADAKLTVKDLADAFVRFSDSVTATLAKYLDKISSALEKLTPEQAETIKNIVKGFAAWIALNSGIGIASGIIHALTGNISVMATALLNASKKITRFLNAFSPSKIKTAIKGISDLADTVRIKMMDIDKSLRGAATKGRGAAESGAEWAGKIISGFVGGITTFLAVTAGPLIKKLVLRALAAVGLAIAGFSPAGWVAALVLGIITAIGIAYDSNFLGFKDFIDGIGRWVNEEAIPAVLRFGKEIGDNFGKGVETVKKWIGDVATWIGKIPEKIGRFVDEVVVNFTTLATEVGIWLGKIPAAIGKFISEAIGKVTTFAGEVSANVGRFIDEVILNITTFGGELVANITGALTTFADNWHVYLGYALGAVVGTIVTILFNIAQFGLDLVGKVATFLGEVWTNFTTAFGTIITDLATWFGTTIVSVIGWAGEFVAGIVDWLGKLPGNIADFFTTIITALTTWFATNIPIIAAEAYRFLMGIVDWVATLPGKIADFFGEVIKNVTTWFTTNIPIIAAEAYKFLMGIVDWIAKLPGKIADFFGQVIRNINTWFEDNIAPIALKAYNLLMGIVDWIAKLPGKIATFFGEVVTNITTWFTTNIPLIAAEAGKLVDGIIAFFIALPGNIITAIGDLGAVIGKVFSDLIKEGSKFMKGIVKVGEDIIRGIWAGIENMVKWIKDKIDGFLKGFTDGINDTLDISSPSKVFAGIGENMIKGLAKGISETDAAMVAMSGVLVGLAGATNDAQLSLASVGGTFNQNVSQDSTKTIKLEVDVTSADGSVGSLDMTKLAGLITGSDMTRSLERMSTVD